MTGRKILGIIPLGTSLSAESAHTISLGCWDGHALLTPIIDSWTTNTSNPDFVPDDSYCDYLVDTWFGDNCGKEVREFWAREIKDNYRGEEGRRRIRMAAINLRDRDGLRGRLWDVRCPVLWLHVSSSLLHLPFLCFLVSVSYYRLPDTTTSNSMCGVLIREASIDRARTTSSTPSPTQRRR